jgi:hypothetical protein
MTVNPATKQLYGQHVTSRDVIGAGGWVTGIDIAADGTKIIRNDVAGCYYRKASDTRWTLLYRAGDNIMPVDIIANGIYDAAIAHSNSAHMAFILYGRLYLTTDGGATLTWCQAWGGDPACYPNDTIRTTGKPLQYDPTNPAVIFTCTPTLGLQYTLDGGASWTAVPTSTLPLPTKASIAFDKTSASGGRCQSLYVWIAGTGLYWSGDGGGTWAQVPGSTTLACASMAVGPDSRLHMCGSDTSMDYNGVYNRWDGSAFYSPGSVPAAKSLAISPVTGNLYLVDVAGDIYMSTDSGDNFTTWMDKRRQADRITWHGVTDEYYMANGGLGVDANDTLWMVEGIGAWQAPAPHAYVSPIVWTEASVGIESMVVRQMGIKPDGTLLAAMDDRTAMVMPRPGVDYPATNANDGVMSIRHGGGIDYAPNNPNILVTTIKEGKGMFSANNGANWTNFPGDIQAASGGWGGGNIIAFDDQIFVQQQTNDAKCMRTTDGGANWLQVMIGNGLNTWAHHQYTLNRCILVRDYFTPGAAWLYHVGDGSGDVNDLACRGLWRTTDKGAHWARVYNGWIDSYTRDFWNGKLYQRSATELWWAGGNNSYACRRSLDGGASWAGAPGDDAVIGPGSFFTSTYGVAFGPAPIAGQPAAIYVVGFRTTVGGAPPDFTGFGLWQSLDDAASWVRLVQYPGGYFDEPSGLIADPNTYGKIYVSYANVGIVMLTFTDVRALTGTGSRGGRHNPRGQAALAI